MPKPVANWERALRALAGSDLLPTKEAQLGFRVPPAHCIVSPTKTETFVQLLQGWLRIRPGILKNLNNPSSNVPIELSAKQWRSMLDVSGGLYTGDSTNSTRTGRHHLEMRRLLERANIDLLGPATTLVYWRGSLVSSVEVPPEHIAQEILCELCELNFRNEFIALDRVLDQSRMQEVDPRQLLAKCWEGSAWEVEKENIRHGLGARDHRTRMAYLRCFHAVVRTWRGEKPAEVLDEFPRDSVIEAHNFGEVIDRVEFALAFFYCQSFMQQFGRAGSVPHCLEG